MDVSNRAENVVISSYGKPIDLSEAFFQGDEQALEKFAEQAENLSFNHQEWVQKYGKVIHSILTSPQLSPEGQYTGVLLLRKMIYQIVQESSHLFASSYGFSVEKVNTLFENIRKSFGVQPHCVKHFDFEILVTQECFNQAMQGSFNSSQFLKDIMYRVKQKKLLEEERLKQISKNQSLDVALKCMSKAIYDQHLNEKFNQAEENQCKQNSEDHLLDKIWARMEDSAVRSKQKTSPSNRAQHVSTKRKIFYEEVEGDIFTEDPFVDEVLDEIPLLESRYILQESSWVKTKSAYSATKRGKREVARPIPVATSLSRQDFMRKALNLTPDNPRTHVYLGETMAEGESLSLLNGKVVTKRELYLLAIHLSPSYARAYLRLGETLSNQESIQLLQGKEMTQQDLFEKVLELDPCNVSACQHLGRPIPLENGLHYDDTELFKVQLYFKEIQKNPRDATSYNNLGVGIKSGSISFPDGTIMTNQQLFLKAIELDPKNSLLYINLAKTLLPQGRIQLFDGTFKTKQQLYLTALQLDEKCAEAYLGLGITLNQEESIKLSNRKCWSQHDLFVRAFELEKNSSEVCCNLGVTLAFKGEDEIKCWNGKKVIKVTRQDLFLRAIRLDPHNATAYYNLALAVPLGESIRFRSGLRMSKQDLFLHAIHFHPHFSQAYTYLADILPGGTMLALLNGKHMTKQQLYDQAKKI